MKKTKVNTRIVTETTTTLLESDDIISCNRRDNGVTVYLDSAKSYSNKLFEVNKIDSSSTQVTIVAQAEEKIGKENSFAISSLFGSIKFKTQGKKGWEIVSTDPINGGGGITLDKLSENAIPFKNNEGDLVDSGFKLEEKMIISSKDLELPPNTLHLGTNIKMHENGGFVEYHTNTLNKNYILVDYENDLINGTSDPVYWKRYPLEVKHVIQDNASEIIDNIKSFDFQLTDDSEVSKLYINVNGEVKNLRFRIIVNGKDVAYYPSKDAFYNEKVGGYFFDDGINEIVLEPHFSFLKDYGVITFELACDNISLRGFNNAPFFLVDRNVVECVPFADSKSVIKYFGDNMRLRCDVDELWFEYKNTDNKGNPIWQPYSLNCRKGMISPRLYLRDLDEANGDSAQTMLFSNRIPRLDERGEPNGEYFNLLMFNTDELGDLGVCVTENGNPFFMNDHGNMQSLASVDYVDSKIKENTGWDEKIDLTIGENIDITHNRETEQLTFVQPSVVFMEHVDTIKTFNIPFKNDFNGTMNVDIICGENDHAKINGMTINGVTVEQGGNKNIPIVRGSNNIYINIIGAAWSKDGGDVWRNGSLGSITFNCTTDTKAEEPLFIDDVVNKNLLPTLSFPYTKYLLIDANGRFVNGDKDFFEVRTNGTDEILVRFIKGEFAIDDYSTFVSYCHTAHTLDKAIAISCYDKCQDHVMIKMPIASDPMDGFINFSMVVHS